MTETRALYIPAPYQDAADSGRLILMDGSTAALRVAIPADVETLREFFERLSPESRRFRFHSGGLPEDGPIDFLCNASDPAKQMTLVDPAVRLNASFSPVFPPPGNLAMSSQSGALGLAVLAFAAERDLGLSTFVSVGNKADVSGNDLLQYWETDNATRVILMYLESFGNPRRFARIARRVGRTKPIVAVKAGRTRAGRRAAGSHTAALAADDVAVDALFRQTGVIRAETLEELFDIAALLGNQPLVRGRRIGPKTIQGTPDFECSKTSDTTYVPRIPRESQETSRLLARIRYVMPAAAMAVMVMAATTEMMCSGTASCRSDPFA
jgi:hypothetical protein